MQRDDSAFLLDMLLAARDAVRFASEVTQRQFEESRLRQNAIIKAVEIVGEAASRVSEQTRKAHPEIPWPKIIGMRNRLVHGYFEVNLSRVWETVQADLPRLIALIQVQVPPEEL